MVEYCALIIDDDIWMQRILSKTLQSYGFRKTILASNGYEGISLAIEHLPDIIVLDILMPDLSGHQTLKLLRSINLTKNIPVLMVSALSDTENLGKAVKMGVNGYISKPFTRTTVYEKLLNIFGQDRMEKIAAGEPIETTISDHELNLKNLIARAEEEDISQPKVSESQASSLSEKVSSSYREEDEEKNIEVIKKLLLKTKKPSE
ncbi:MAG: response regulator [Ignavibacteria bacterium]|nr:response regulator [Ignavibacteria bacterium]